MIAAIAVILGVGAGAVWYFLLGDSAGEEITLAAVDDDGWSILSVAAEGGEAGVVFDLAPRSGFPDLSPDGTRAVFSNWQDDPDGVAGDLYVVTFDGGGLLRLTETPGVDECCPVWSPDGERIAYVGYDNQIHVMAADGGTGTLIERSSGAFDPQWSPTGDLSYVLEGSDAAGGVVFRLTVADPDTGESRVVVEAGWYISGYAWSGTGDQIAYFVDGDGLWSVAAAGGSPRRLAEIDEDDVSGITWSPDGAQIVLAAGPCCEDAPDHDLYSVRADGGRSTSLTSGPASDELPVWSPDGQAIAFARSEDGGETYDTFVIDVASGDLRRLTSTAHRSEGPLAWTE